MAAELPCEVRQGGLQDAILHSAGANAAHGLRRTNADKRRAVLMLLQDAEWAAWSDREIARRCAVSTDTVGRYRKEQDPSVEIGQMDQPRTVSRGGKVYTMDTGRIGQQQPEPDPKPAVPDALADALARQFRQEAEQVPETQSRPAALMWHQLCGDPDGRRLCAAARRADCRGRSRAAHGSGCGPP